MMELVLIILATLVGVAFWYAQFYYFLSKFQRNEIKGCLELVEKAHKRVDKIRSETLEEVSDAIHFNYEIDPNDPDKELWEEIYGEIAVLIASKKNHDVD